MISKTECMPSKYFDVYTIELNSVPIKIKVVDVPVNAGFPSPAQDFIEDVIDLNALLIKHPASTFVIKVKGVSMIEAGIYDQSQIIVDTSLRPIHDDIAVCVIDGEFTLKRLSISKDKIVLMPDNKNYKPIEMKEGNQLTVWGVVTHIIHKPNSKRL